MAYHEAGHAVVGVSVGRACIQLEPSAQRAIAAALIWIMPPSAAGSDFRNGWLSCGLPGVLSHQGWLRARSRRVQSSNGKGGGYVLAGRARQ
jgi:hypothetical protein